MNSPCPLCGGSRAPGNTTFTADLGFGVVVVRHVPAQVCECCGEEWLDDRVAAELEQVVADARRHNRQVEVAEWHAFAAA